MGLFNSRYLLLASARVAKCFVCLCVLCILSPGLDCVCSKVLTLFELSLFVLTRIIFSIFIIYHTGILTVEQRSKLSLAATVELTRK